MFPQHKIHFIYSKFIILKVKNCISERKFWNGFFSSGFLISETPFAYITSPILKSPKTTKDNLRISNKIGCKKKYVECREKQPKDHDITFL